MKGFKKDGKFRPTEKRNKSGLSKKNSVDIIQKRSDGHIIGVVEPNTDGSLVKKKSESLGINIPEENVRRSNYGIQNNQSIKKAIKEITLGGRSKESLDEPKQTFGEFLKTGNYLQSEVESRAEKGSPYFFNKDTMKSFSSRVSELMWQKGGSNDSSYKTKDIYFITSEQDKGFGEYRGSPRAYTVRVVDADGDINDIGGFQAYSTVNEARHAIQDILEGNDE